MPDPSEAQTIIANQALYRIGAKRLASLDDGSPNSILINDIYPQVLGETLSEHPWTFAVQIVALASLTLSVAIPTVDVTWYAYALPADYLKVYKLLPNSRFLIRTLKTPYVASPTLALLTDNSSLTGVHYVFNNTDPTSYTDKFCDALSLNLARKLCFKISEAAQYAAAIKAEYKESLTSAISDDSNNETPDQPIADEWFVARLSGSAPLVGLGPDNNNVGFYVGDY